MGIFRKKDTDESLKAATQRLRPEDKNEMKLWRKLQKMEPMPGEQQRDFTPKHARQDVGDCVDGGTILSDPEED